jgi:hypothetical protein
MPDEARRLCRREAVLVCGGRTKGGQTALGGLRGQLGCELPRREAPL